MESERFPGKVLADVEGKPLMAWIVERLRPLGTVIVATTEAPGDDAIVDVAKAMGAPIYRGDTDDVVGRVDSAVKMHAPRAGFVLRALGDCPFMATELVQRAVKIMHRESAECFLWNIAPDAAPCYGAREFPFSRSGWEKIVKNARGPEREHSDLWFHKHRADFARIYHEPPPNGFFRSHRTEIDWPEDLAMVRAVAKGIGMLAPMLEILGYLDAHPEVAALNRERVEKTGLVASYSYQERRAWMKAAEGQSVVTWDGSIWQPSDARAVPIYCQSGRCWLGFGSGGTLHGKFGRLQGRALLVCPCGAGRTWKG